MHTIYRRVACIFVMLELNVNSAVNVVYVFLRICAFRFLSTVVYVCVCIVYILLCIFAYCRCVNDGSLSENSDSESGEVLQSLGSYPPEAPLAPSNSSSSSSSGAVGASRTSSFGNMRSHSLTRPSTVNSLSSSSYCTAM